VIIVHTQVLTRSLIVFAAVASLLMLADHADAQQLITNSNPTVGTFGDISQSKLRARVNSAFGLRLGPGGLFGDAEVFGNFSQPRPFIFPLPDFAGAGLSFADATFAEYLDLVVQTYGLPDEAAYKNIFLAQNVFSVTNNLPFFFTFPDLQQRWFGFPDSVKPLVLSSLNDTAFDRFHKSDFRTGGGFLPASETETPGADPADGVGPQLPKDPFGLPIIPPGPTDTTDDTTDDTTTDPIFMPFPEPTIPTLPGGLTSSSLSAPTPAPTASVSLVPEPATLGLMSLGITLILKRSRRR